MAKNIYIYLKLCFIHMCTGGVVVKAWAAEPHACALLFIKSWRVKRKTTHFRKLYVTVGAKKFGRFVFFL
jgi:hypothetical protein